MVVGVLCFAMLVAPVSASAAAQDYGALAYSPVKNTIGYASAGTRAAAEAGAKANCEAKGGSANCEVFVWFSNAWGALAESTNGHVGSGWGWDSRGSDQARHGAGVWAVKTCQDAHGKRCHVVLDRAAGKVSGPGTGGAGPNWSYAALGDSYSSGEGTGNYGDTDTSTNKCHRSAVAAYGPLLKRDVPTLGDLNFYACSGAVTDDFYTAGVSKGKQHNKGEVKQRDRIRIDADSVTLTIGGNDLDFEGVLRRCVKWVGNLNGWGCSEDVNLKKTIDKRLAALITGKGAKTAADSRRPNRPIHSLFTLLVDIHNKSKEARIFVGGYPRLFGTDPKYYTPYPKKLGSPSGHICLVGPVPTSASIDFNDAKWLNQGADSVNKALLSAVTAAQKKGVPVTFVDVSSAFTTHGLCDSGKGKAWIGGVHVNPFDWLNVQESFHPTPAGQSAYEASFRKAEGV